MAAEIMTEQQADAILHIAQNLADLQECVGVWYCMVMEQSECVPWVLVALGTTSGAPGRDMFANMRKQRATIQNTAGMEHVCVGWEHVTKIFTNPIYQHKYQIL